MNTPPSSQKCSATAKRTGERCTKWPVKGAAVCPSHGGRAPQVRAKAQQRVVEGQAIKAVRGMGSWTPITDPLSALADVAGEVTAVKDFLRGLVNEIVEREQRDAGGSVVSIVGSAVDRLTGAETLRSTDDKGAEQLNAKFQAYMTMLDRTVQTLATIAKLKIDERMAAIDEARSQMIMEALRRTWAEMGIAGEAQTRGMATLGRHLRVVGREQGRRAA